MSKAAFKPDSGLSGLLVVDKPTGPTSHDVVARVRRIASTRRVGHTGTLDPMASGVLVLCLGKATRLIPFIEEQGGTDAKEYVADVRFGFETTTDDLDGEPRGERSTVGMLSSETVAAALKRFEGESRQTPPAFSAKKIAGERAYALARRGEEVALQAVDVHVAVAELLSFEGEVARIRFACSRGTYIRALARDLGRALGVGAHLIGLRRTRSGTNSLMSAIPLEEVTGQSLAARLVPMASVLEWWPKVTVGEKEASDIRLGRAVNVSRGAQATEARVRVCDQQGDLVALAAAQGARLQPFCVF